MEERHENPLHREPKKTGFAEGTDQKPDTPAELLQPDFARGVREGPEPDAERHTRFSEGAEELPDTPDKTVERRFSEGVERSPHST
jgi:hypothetical protein